MKYKFNPLKEVNLLKSTVSIAIVKEYKQGKELHYKIEYIPIEEALESRVKDLMINRINKGKGFYNYITKFQETGPEIIRTINFERTNFFRILEVLLALDSYDSEMENGLGLVMAKSYILILRNEGEIEAAVVKAIPKGLRLKGSKEIVPLLFREITSV
ncbi:MAG: hypothetical protein V3U92_15675 [Cellulophaga sp.]